MPMVVSLVNEADSNDDLVGIVYGDPNVPLIGDEWCRCIKCFKL